MKTRAILFTGVDNVTITETEVPEPGDGEVLIETAYSGMSPGTELRCLSGQQNNMPDFPFIPGYALTGRIIARGANVSLPEGLAVFCGGTSRVAHNRLWGGHIGHAVTAARNVYPIPENVSLKDAALTKLGAIVLRGVRMAQPQPWETVVVVGLGVIGHIAARMHAVTGARVIGVDTVAWRAEKLRQAGLEALSAAPDSLAEAVRTLLPGGADVVVDATGANAAVRQAILMAKELPYDDVPLPPTRYVVQGSFVGDWPIPYYEAFQHELNVLFTRDVRPGDLRTVLDLLHRGRLSFAGLADEALTPEQAPETYRALKERTGDRLVGIYQWH